MIEIYNDGVRVARSTKAFNVIVTKELMRAYTLDAEFTNQDNSRQYITTSSMFKADGQLFDIVGFQQNSGRGNTTKISADHVGYRLNNYKIPPLFSTMGTIAEIAQAILDESGASAEFTVGTCADLDSKAFSLGNEQETTCRSALFAMSALGVEMDFDNFTLNFPERVGSDTGKVFEFGKDLVDLNRVWDKGNGTTYDITIANLQRVPGHSGDEFELGDDVTVKDYFIGDSIKRRIVSYKKCLDKPTIDTVTLGVFVRDIFDDTADMAVDIKQRIVEGQAYNGNRINRTEGFVSETDDGQKKITMSGTEGFSAWVWESDAWVRKSWMDEMGLVTSKLSNPNSDGTYGTIGKGPEEYDGYGLFLINPALGTVYQVYPANWGGMIYANVEHKADYVSFIKNMTIVAHSFEFLSAGIAESKLRWVSSGSNGETSVSVGVSGIEFMVDDVPYGANGATPTGKKPVFVNGICTGFTT